MSCQTLTLCDSSVTEMVDTDNTAGRDRQELLDSRQCSYFSCFFASYFSYFSSS